MKGRKEKHLNIQNSLEDLGTVRWQQEYAGQGKFPPGSAGDIEEEILNRNIKSRATDLLKNQSINKSYKELKAGLTLNDNDLKDLGLKDLLIICFARFFIPKTF